MGKYVILATLALAVATTVISRQGMETDLDTSESQAARQEKVLARQIATSAFEMGISELRRDFENWRVQRSGVSYEGGTFDLTATGPTGGPVDLTAEGHYEEKTYKITGQVKLTNTVKSFYHAVTTKGEMDFTVRGAGCSGGACVSGIDDAGQEDRHGINLWASDDADDNEEDVCSEFGDQVEGKGDGCDVVSREKERDDRVVSLMNDLESKIEALPSDQKTVCEPSGGTECTLLPTDSDTGVYHVKGDLTINGNAEWGGIIYVSDGGSVSINGGGGTKNINGSLLMEKDTDIEMNGGNRIKYNSEKILDIVSTLPAVAVETIEISDQSGRFIE